MGNDAETRIFAKIFWMTMDPNGGKKGLYNKLSREQLIEKRNRETFKRRTVSFYRYVMIDNPHEMRDSLFVMWNELDCLGRIYVAREGINAQMNVPEHNWDAFVEHLYAFAEFDKVPFKIAVEDDGNSFYKLVVKVRNQIVADGLAEGEYDVTNVGRHLTADEWNEVMEKGDPVVVDMRNFYESEIGHFEGAVLPEAETFREELPEVLQKLKGSENRKILLYCTGGIRCEKTSAYLKHHGFEDVNQLYGGIIDYYRQIKEKNLPNKFKGANFVFDDRLAETIGEEVISKCHQCGTPVSKHVNCANKACNVLFLQCPACAEKMEGCCSEACREVIHLPEEQQIEIRRKAKAESKGKRYLRKKEV